MKRYREIETMIETGKLSNEEIMVLNEATLMKNIVEFQKNKVKQQHETIVIPLFDDHQQVIRRMGIFEKERVKSTEVDIAIMKGEVQSSRFLVIPVECDGAKLFEPDPKPQTAPKKEEAQGLPNLEKLTNGLKAKK